MTICELVDPPAALLSAAAERESVRSAMNEAHEALARLRFHEGLRHGWQEARAEASVREATALAVSEGLRISVDDIRAWSMHPPRSSEIDPTAALALGIWRSQWNVARTFTPLNSRHTLVSRRAPEPLPARLSGIHRDICSALVTGGWQEVSTVAKPVQPQHIVTVKNYCQAPVPTLIHAAAIVAHFRFREVMRPASACVGAAFARSILVEHGVDPTGVAVLSAHDAYDPAAASSAIAGWVQADEDGVARWVEHFMRSIVTAARVGEDVALHIQGRSLG
ncbi:hypothetical protein [Schaalia sp. lx-100]|uniref:hypothetical protein n=1 Tax=Schaalia sp. lx-100 TaxID=2899081 RepID=UPI001E4CFE56|nr:hypothetical protein [Schaalia sp. lx-100]